MQEKIDRLQFDELNVILWDMQNRFVDAEVAFQMYERRWNYVDEKNMGAGEKLLLEDLVKRFGGGHFMPSGVRNDILVNRNE